MSIVSWMRRLPIVASLVVLPSVAAQLAITEVHSSASTNGTVALHADWWELTNLGAQPVDLTGYRFNDATGGLAAGSVTLPSLTLAAGESMVLVNPSVPMSSGNGGGRNFLPDCRSSPIPPTGLA
jgi:hypothetical protein